MNLLQLGAAGIACLALHPLAAQTVVHGRITGEQGQPLSSATVLLLAEADSSLVKGALSNREGGFLLEGLQPGTYLLAAKLAGHADYYSPAFRLQAQDGVKELGAIALQEAALTIAEVILTAQKPLYEQRIDRLSINVENSITAAGANALEILERSPGVTVNRQNSLISMAGKAGVVLMINGKPSRMPPEAIAQYLAGMPAGNIQRIELISTPPAQLDAEGNAGYINIVLKQRSDFGTNGSLTVSAGAGRGTTASTAISLNYRNERFNLFGSYALSRQAQEFAVNAERELLLNGQQIRVQNFTLRRPSVQRNHNLRAGLDWNLGARTVLGLLLSGYDNRYSQESVNRTITSLNGLVDTLLSIPNQEINHWQHLGGNLNFLHRFGERATLAFDADYLYYKQYQPVSYELIYRDGKENFLFSSSLFSSKSTPIRIGVGKVDYTAAPSERLRLEAGLKATQSRFDNDIRVLYIRDGVYLNDPELNGLFFMDEVIAAAYAAADFQANARTQLKAGLRYEYTDTRLGSEQDPELLARRYGRWFPSIFLSRTLSEQQSLGLSFSRRITRPSFNDLAPFVYVIDPNTTLAGNLALQPSIASSVKLDYRFKSALLSLQYTHEDSAIAFFQLQVQEGTLQQQIASQNMKNRRTAAASIALPWQPAPWFSMQHSLTAIWQEANTYVFGDLVQIRAASLQINSAFRFSLPGALSAEIAGFYQSRGVSGGSVSLPAGILNAGIQKTFKGQGGSLRFGVDDLLNSLQNRVEIRFPEYGIYSSANIDFSQRTFKLSYARSFGNSQLKAARQREGGAGEERQRVQ
ncbi:MAG: TonB-dependent receptor [Bacteroidia bacterium]|nr:TonB-dependent receptor [Bacteroidia bacterium]